MFGTGVTMSLAEWIIDDTCLVLHCFQFVYVNQAFSPSPDQTVRNIYECFGSDGKLILYYSKSQMWG